RSGAQNEPRYVRRDVRLDRIQRLLTDPAALLADVYQWGTSQFNPEPMLGAALAFYHPEAAVELGEEGGDAFLETGALRWSRDSSRSPPGLMLDVSAAVEQDYVVRTELDSTWGLDFESD